jgi:hypothetical protein
MSRETKFGGEVAAQFREADCLNKARVQLVQRFAEGVCWSGFASVDVMHDRSSFPSWPHWVTHDV